MFKCCKLNGCCSANAIAAEYTLPICFPSYRDRNFIYRVPPITNHSNPPKNVESMSCIKRCKPTTGIIYIPRISPYKTK